MNRGVNIKNLAHSYGGRTIFSGIDLSAPSGELISLLGRNGVGKSTLLKIITGLLTPQEGEVRIDGRDISSMGREEMASLVSFVSTEIIRVGGLSVRNIVEMGRAPYTGWRGRLSEADLQAVNDSLSLVGMLGMADKGISTLSDGERQRVMIARALAQDTPVIILDEPTAFLDVPNKYEIVLLLRKLAREGGKTIIFSTHDVEVALRLCDSVCVMDRGGISCGSPEDMMASGGMAPLFGDTGMELDIRTSQMKLSNNDFLPLRLEAPERLYALIERGLERVGYRVGGEGDRVKAEETPEGVSIKYISGNGEMTFNSIGALLKNIGRR